MALLGGSVEAWSAEEKRVGDEVAGVEVDGAGDDAGEISGSGGCVMVGGDERCVVVECSGDSVTVVAGVVSSPVSLTGEANVEGIVDSCPAAWFVSSTDTVLSVRLPTWSSVSVVRYICASFKVVSILVLLSASHSSHFHSSRCVRPYTLTRETGQ